MTQQSNLISIVNSIFLAGTYFIAVLGAVLISVGLYNIWKGDTEGFIMFIPGVVVLIIGVVFNKLLKKWLD